MPHLFSLRRKFRPLLCFALFSGACLAAEPRTFTDLQGRTLKGELLAVKDDTVVIKREDGQTFILKASDFSPADRMYFRNQSVKVPGSADAPPPAPISPPNNGNLFVNPTFEKGTDGWVFHAYHSAAQMTIDTTEKYDNKPSMRIESTGDDAHAGQKVTLKPGKKYRLSGYIKTKGMRMIGKNPKDKSTHGAEISLLAGFTATVPVEGTHTWKKVTLEFTADDKPPTDIGPRIGGFGCKVEGTAWFADLVLEEVGAK